MGKERGFTTIELVIVIVILGVIAALVGQGVHEYLRTNGKPTHSAP